MSKIIAVQSLLIDVEACLRNLQCWDDTPPTAQALASTTPFAVDVMELYQWLQWIFIPKMHDLLVRQRLVTMACGIAPMAEQWAAGRGLQAQALIACLADLDELLSGE